MNERQWGFLSGTLSKMQAKNISDSFWEGDYAFPFWLYFWSEILVCKALLLRHIFMISSYIQGITGNSLPSRGFIFWILSFPLFTFQWGSNVFLCIWGERKTIKEGNRKLRVFLKTIWFSLNWNLDPNSLSFSLSYLSHFLHYSCSILALTPNQEIIILILITILSDPHIH